MVGLKLRKNMKTIKIGLIGFGTIGSAVSKVILEREHTLREKLGFKLELVKICDKDLKTKRDVKLPKNILTKDINDILDNKDIDIVVELMGGVHPASEIVEKALKKGKSVVTANKALLSHEGKHLFHLASELHQEIGFEASVGGGIPIIKSLKESFFSNKIESIYGIVNGTSNFILTKMTDSGLDFKSALSEAQKLGYAEKDPTLDINGSDSAHKLSVLAMLAFGKFVPIDNIYRDGIEGIEALDISFAKDSGYAIKLLAIAKKHNDELELRVHPTLISKNNLLSNIKDAYNAIYVKGDLVGEALFYGLGAGKFPTATSVISDLADIARKKIYGGEPLNLKISNSIKNIKNISEIKTRYYIRFQAIDKPGVLASVANILGKYDISIASVTQKEQHREHIVPIVMMTHEASESEMKNALRSIDKLSSIKKKTIAIRVENI